MVMKLFAAVLLSLVAFWSGSVGLWVADRSTPLIMIRAQALEPHAVPGGDLLVRYTVQRARICRVTVERVLVDAAQNRFIMETLELHAPGPLGEEVYLASLPVPMKAAVGPAQYRITNVWRCNPIHIFWPIVHEQTPLRFEIKSR